MPTHTLTGDEVTESLHPALQWLQLGFAVHPLQRGSKAWQPEYRSWSIEQRIEDVIAHPDAWSRLGVEPGSEQSDHRWIVVDDDSNKGKWTDDQRLCAQDALAALLQDARAGASGSCVVPCIQTPSGNFHYYLRNADGMDVSNLNLAGVDLIGQQNAATWPTEGYTVVAPFASRVEDNPWIPAKALSAFIGKLKGAPIGSASVIRERGRNNHARDLLWRCCMTAIRVHQTEQAAEQMARDLWESRVQEMSEALGGESPEDWGVNPDRDFTRAWPKALRAKQEMDELGVFFDDGYLCAWTDPPKQEPEPAPFIAQPIASIQRQTVYLNRPTGPSHTGTQVEAMDGTRVFLDDRHATQTQVVQALAPLLFRSVPNARYGKLGWLAHQAVAMGLRISASGSSWAIPTGVWWKHEFPVEMQDNVPDAPWACYTPRGVILPDGTLDESTMVTAIEAQQVFHSAALSNYVPWTLGTVGDRSAMQAFCRTLAGFQVPRTAAAACSLSTLGLIRGWLRGNSLVGKAQPFVSIEGPAGSGKTTGIFAAAFGLAGAKVAHRSEAMYSVEMTQSRCAQLVMDDQDLGPEWGDILRIQQTESGWNKTNSLRELLGLTTIVSQGFALLERDQALQDRAYRIIVSDTAKSRRSLVNPDVFQVQDLDLVSSRTASTHQGSFTVAVMRAIGQVDVDRAVQTVGSHWFARRDLAARQQLVMISVEIALRVFCWIACGQPDVEWWSCEPSELDFDCAPGCSVSLVSTLRDVPEDSDQLASQRKATAPLAIVLASYLQQHPFADWDHTADPQDAKSWCRQHAMWISQGRMAVRPAALRAWAQSQPWPQGVRRLLFTTQQFQSDMDSLGATGMQVSHGVQFRRIGAQETQELLRQMMGWQDERTEPTQQGVLQ